MAKPEVELTYFGLPDAVRHVLGTLLTAGHQAVLVGGCVRDRLLDLEPDSWDWDAATSAAPEVVAHLFPDATWENRFGTVTVRGQPAVEVTSFRTEGAYPDGRRPAEVRFGASLPDDLGRRDFTINAMAWVPVDLDAGRGTLVDPFGGGADLERRVLRTVGDPRQRFAEDALRLIRAARFAGRFSMMIEDATEAAIRDLAPSAATVSPDRVRDELDRILASDTAPSRALRTLDALGLLNVVLPEVAGLRGVPQQKPVPGDAFDHTLAAVDAAPAEAPVDTRLTALLHDIGKASTMAGGHFIGHEEAGAELAASALARLRVSRARGARIVAAIRHHMYHFEDSWTDAAVRRFIRRTDGVDRELLFALRRADNAASGAGEEGERNQAELERRIGEQIARQPDLLLARRLAIDGDDLQRELAIAPGPALGRLLERLTEAVLDDPARNEREALLTMARDLAGER